MIRYSAPDSSMPTKNRVEALVDGIFSVAMTLLVLDVKLPSGLTFATNEDLLRHFASVEFSFGIYVVSFCVLAMFWIAHHYQFRFVERVDRPLLWINLFFLLFTTLVPFSTSLIASHGTLQVPVVIYAANLLLLYLMLWLHLRRMRRMPALTNGQFSSAVSTAMGRRLRTFCVIPIVGMLVALYSPPWGIRVFYLLAVLHLMPELFERLDRQRRAKEREDGGNVGGR
jgi:uncharacterized membrane protein